jgi:hypothetical protein
LTEKNKKHKASDPSPPNPPSPSQSREDDRYRAEEEHRRQDDAFKNRQVEISTEQLAFNRRISRYTLALVIVGLIGNYVSFIAASAAKRSADAATANVEAARLDQRAWVGIRNVDGSFDISKPSIIQIRMNNSGRTPAINTRTNHIVECVKPGTMPAFVESEANITGVETIFPGAERVMIHSKVCSATRDAEDPSRLGDVLNGRLDLYVYGTIWYSDIFRNNRSTSFCFFYDRDTHGMNLCRVHNTGN